MFFSKKKSKEKKFIDYILQDIPLGLDDSFAISQATNAAQSSMRSFMLGPEKGSVENAAIADALKAAWFMSIIAGVAEKFNIKIPDDYRLYHAMLIQDAWGTRGGVNFGDPYVSMIKATVNKTFDSLLDDQKQRILGFIKVIFPEIVSFEHAKAFIAVANKITIQYQ